VFRVEQERIVHRAATSVSSVLTEVPLSIQTVMLMDLIDEIFDLISGEMSSPAECVKFIDSCLDIQHYT
jgi:hypothetical protein